YVHHASGCSAEGQGKRTGHARQFTQLGQKLVLKRLSGMPQQEIFKMNPVAEISASIADLVAFSITLQAEEIDGPGAYFHRHASWLARNLPAPLINDVGVRYLSDDYRVL